jgi:hypothetical protein
MPEPSRRGALAALGALLHVAAHAPLLNVTGYVHALHAAPSRKGSICCCFWAITLEAFKPGMFYEHRSASARTPR